MFKHWEYILEIFALFFEKKCYFLKKMLFWGVEKELVFKII